MIINPSEGFLVEENNQNFEKLGPILPVRLFLSEVERRILGRDAEFLTYAYRLSK